MKKQVKLIALVLLALAAGGGWTYYSKPKITKENKVGTTVENKIAFAEFLKNNKESYKCTVYYPFQAGTVVATIYRADNMIRGEYKSPYENVEVKFIIRDGYYYPWTSKSATSTKIAIPRDPQGNQSGEIYYSYIRSVGEYECNPWTMDASMFAVPQNIKFETVVDY